MTTITIEDNDVKVDKLIGFIRSTMVETKKESFKKASEECNAVSVDTFFDKLDERIKRRFDA